MISFSPSEEQQMITTMVRQFATDEMRKIYRDCDESGDTPASILETAWQMGFISSSIPEEQGGLGEEHSAVTGSLLAEELAWGDLSMAMNILCPLLVVSPLIETGTASQKSTYLPRFCQDDFVAATAALIEPRFGFEPFSLSTNARLDNNSYILNGGKCYVPLAADSELIIVYANENGQTQGFILEKGTDGLKIGEREKNMGIKALPTYELSLNECRIPRENRLGGENGSDFSHVLNYSQVALAAMAIGVARAAFEYARDYAKDRQAFGEPIASRQTIAFMLAEMAMEIDATRLMTWEAAWKLDKGEDASLEASLLRTYADDMVLMVTDRAVQILGGHGYVREHPVELWLRNGRGFTTFTGMATV